MRPVKCSASIGAGILGSRGGMAPGGIEAADLAAAAIVDILEGNRVWDPKAHPDLLNFLRSVVDSKVSPYAKLKARSPEV